MTTWTRYGAGAPRYVGASSRLLVERQSTNSVRNPYMLGAVRGVLGAGGLLPTDWSISNPGFTVEVIGVFKRDGLDVLRVRIRGTSNGGQCVLATTPPATVSAGPNQTWTSTFIAALVEDYAVPDACRIATTARTSAGGSVVGYLSTDLSLQRTLTQFRYTTGLGTDVTIGAVTSGLRFYTTANVSYDFTVDVAAPVLEQALNATTPVLPEPLTSAFSTRGAEIISVPLNTLNMDPGGDCTIIGQFMIPELAPVGVVHQTLFYMASAGDAQSVRAYNQAGGAAIRIGGNVLAPGLGNITAGVPFVLGLTWDGLGRVAGCINGGAVQSSTGNAVGFMTNLFIGNAMTPSSALNGQVGPLSIMPGYVMPDARLLAHVNSTPILI
jgi:hypothetical protein